MKPLPTNNDRAARLYSEILNGLPKKADLPSLFIVQHIVPNNLPLFRSLAAKFTVAATIGKPSSVDLGTLSILEEYRTKYKYQNIGRADLERNAGTGSGLPAPPGKKPFVILDVGGYFAPCAQRLYETYGGRLLGIVEDTENGHQRYQAAYEGGGSTPYPVYSVARSPLKEPEDFLVGQSIVYSVESIMRENYSLLTNRQVLVIGYGKIGRSIAASLMVRNINVWVYDKDPVKCAQAMSHGFPVPERDFAIANAGLIFCATGKKSLKQGDFEKLGDNAFVASVTSPDDEFDFGRIRDTYRVTPMERTLTNISIYTNAENSKTFYLIRDGTAVNFAHSNVLGVYIYLVACEILHCLRRLVTDAPAVPHKGIYELSPAERSDIAQAWIDKFGRVLGR